MPITGVTFDLWQTLLIDNRELGLARMQIRLDGALAALREAGEEFSTDQVRDAYRQCYHTCHDIRAKEMDVSFDEQIRIFLRHTDPTLLDRLEETVIERITGIYADSLFYHPPPPHPDAIKVLDGVKTRGYDLGLISNTGMTPGSTFREYMEQLGMLSYFDVLTFSDEVGLAKPATEIFVETAKSLTTPPEHLVHVGDHLVNDVLGAQRAGMKTIWIDTHPEDDSQSEVQPDATVGSLGMVGAALEGLVEGA